MIEIKTKRLIIKDFVFKNDPELRSCTKFEIAVLGSPSIIVLLLVLMVSLDVKKH